MDFYTYETQSIGLQGVINARELGGYRMPDGRTIKRGLLLRGGCLKHPAAEDILRLSEEFKVSLIFDFRTEGEVQRSPDAIVPGARNIWMPTIDPDTETLADRFLPKEAYLHLEEYVVEHSSDSSVQSVARRMYTDMVTNEFTQLQYSAFFQTILNNPDGAIYWHCSQGKDRTGLAAAFVLAALGADRDTIMKDYAISGEYYRKDLDLYIDRVSSPEEKAAMRTFISVNCDYFADALDEIDRKWGSMANYLSGPLCLSDDDMDIMQKRYLE